MEQWLLVLTLTALCISTASADAPIPNPPAPGPATGLADPAALRATVFGTPPQDIAPLPAKVPVPGLNPGKADTLIPEATPY